VSGVEEALETAILATIAGDAAVVAVLGDPLRIADLASPQPAYPFLEFVRRTAEPFNSAGCEAYIVTIDLAVVSREEGGRIARAAMSDVRNALREAEITMEGWHCVVLTPVFADTVRQAIGRWRALLRVRGIVERVEV
jgi:hypothetical protein